MDRLIEILIVLVPVLFGSGGLVMYVVKKHDSNNDKLDKILDVVEQHTESIEEISTTIQQVRRGECETQCYMLNRLYYQFKHQGKITTKQKAQWMRVYKIYKGLGGNGDQEIHNEEVMKLPVDDNFTPVSPFAVEWEHAYDKENNE